MDNAVLSQGELNKNLSKTFFQVFSSPVDLFSGLKCVELNFFERCLVPAGPHSARRAFLSFFKAMGRFTH